MYIVISIYRVPCRIYDLFIMRAGVAETNNTRMSTLFNSAHHSIGTTFLCHLFRAVAYFRTQVVLL